MRGDVSVDLGPHAANAATHGFKSGHHRNHDESGNKPVFNRSRPAPVGAEHAQCFTDSRHATLLWSTSTEAGLSVPGLINSSSQTVNAWSASCRPCCEMEDFENFLGPAS